MTFKMLGLWATNIVIFTLVQSLSLFGYRYVDVGEKLLDIILQYIIYVCVLSEVQTK